MGYLFCSVLITPWVLYRSARHFRQLGRHWLGFVGLGAFAALSTQLGTTAYTLTVSSYGSQAGFLTLGSPYSPQPSRRRRPVPVTYTRLSSPITVTGSWRVRTAFPFRSPMERTWDPDNWGRR